MLLNQHICEACFTHESTLFKVHLYILKWIMRLQKVTIFEREERYFSDLLCYLINFHCCSFFVKIMLLLLITLCIYINKMHKILVIRLYFPLDALHVSDYIIPSSGATFISCTSHLIYAIATQQPDVWHRHIPNAMYSL